MCLFPSLSWAKIITAHEKEVKNHLSAYPTHSFPKKLLPKVIDRVLVFGSYFGNPLCVGFYMLGNMALEKHQVHQ
jgi:hypothetical protein